MLLNGALSANATSSWRKGGGRRDPGWCPRSLLTLLRARTGLLPQSDESRPQSDELHSRRRPTCPLAAPSLSLSFFLSLSLSLSLSLFLSFPVSSGTGPFHAPSLEFTSGQQSGLQATDMNFLSMFNVTQAAVCTGPRDAGPKLGSREISPAGS